MSTSVANGSAATAPVEGSTTPAQNAQEPTQTAAAPVKDQFAERMEIMAKKERTLWRERQRIESETQRLASERAEYEKWKQTKEKAKSNPLEYLSEAGLSYDQLTQFMLNGGKPTEKDELSALRDEFKRLREEQEQDKKKQTDNQTQAQAQAEAQAIATFKEDIGEFVETNKSTYELCATRDATEDIFTTISDAFKIRIQEWNENGRIGRPPGPMAIKDAADIVEEFYEKEVLRLSETQKMRSKLQPQPTTEGQTRTKEPSKTLTNNMASTAASVLPAKNDHDRMRRAMEKLGGS